VSAKAKFKIYIVVSLKCLEISGRHSAVVQHVLDQDLAFVKLLLQLVVSSRFNLDDANGEYAWIRAWEEGDLGSNPSAAETFLVRRN